MWLIAAAVLAAAAEQPALPGWMAGCWERSSGEKWTEECWTSPRAGIMLGGGRSGTGDRLGDWEVMQIVLNQPAGDGPIVRMAFWGAPGGQNPTMFAWSPSEGPGVTFVNETHDYPQRIRYWREGKELVAEIAMKDGSKAVSWRYRPIGD
jgi:hypothetical protein